MGSNITLKNLANTEFKIEHPDGIPAKTISSKDMTVAVDTVAAMQALVPHDGMVCIVRDLDRGGTFIYDSTKVLSSNQGTNFVGWVRQYSGAINVKWFGVVSNAASDASAIVNSIITYCKTYLSGNINLFFPNGTYRLDSHIDLVNTTGFSLIGESMEKTVFIKYGTSTKDYMFTIASLYSRMENFTIIGEGISTTQYSISSAIYIKGVPQVGVTSPTKQLSLKKIKFQRCDIGIQVGYYDNDGFDPDIETNKFEQLNFTEVLTGMFYNSQNAHNNELSNSHFTNCRDACIRTVRGGFINVYRTYFGPMWNSLQNITVADTSIKIKLEASSATISDCHSENQTLNNALFFKSYINAPHTILLERNRIAHLNGATGSVVISLGGTGTAIDSNDSASMIGNNIEGGWIELSNINYVGIANMILDATYQDGYTRVGNQSLRSEFIIEGQKLSDMTMPLLAKTNTFTKYQNTSAVSGILAQYIADSVTKIQLYGTSTANSTQIIFESGAKTRLKAKATDMLGVDSSWFMLSQTATPATQPDGGVLYVESGALKYKGSSGTITTLALT